MKEIKVTLNTEDLIGMSFEYVKEASRNLGVPVRKVAEDGRYFVCTADYIPERINVEVENGKVTKAFLG